MRNMQNARKMNFIFSIKVKSLLVKSSFLFFLVTSIQTYGQSPDICETNGNCLNGICTPIDTSYYCACDTYDVSGIAYLQWGGALCDSLVASQHFYSSDGISVVPVACEADEQMTLSGCTACPEGTTNEAGDTILLGVTSCDVSPTACGADEFAESGSCVACPAGTTNAEGDDPSGGDTFCVATLCQADEFVLNNACESCAVGYTNAAGDDASGADTFCAEIIACAGFEPPMDNYPVRVKKNRALPLKAELFDYEVMFAKTDADLTAPPVVQVMLNGAPTGEGDVSEDALPAGQGSEGNQFVFTDEDKWQFNLKTGQFTAPGTYIVSMESGDPDTYAFVPQCVTEFEIR